MSLAAIESTFRQERSRLFAVGYRMTGSRSDAEDILQEAFARVVAKPPRDLDASLGPYVMRVVVNLSRDRLRARRRSPYRGPWLPEALEHEDGAAERRHGEARYGELESVTHAFLLALEALSPAQRAVLVLRDVLDLSVEETAASLGRTANYVKVAHHRARERMERYDAARVVPDAATLARTRAALERFVQAMIADDAEAMIALMVADCTVTQDAAGEFSSAGKAFSGRERIVTFHRKIRRPGVAADFRIALINGLPTLVAHYGPSGPRLATRVLFQVEVDDAGLVRHIRTTLATAKLAAVTFPAQPS